MKNARIVPAKDGEIRVGKQKRTRNFRGEGMIQEVKGKGQKAVGDAKQATKG